MTELIEKKKKAAAARYLYPVLFVLLIALIAFLAFYRLDVKYVDPWDEARHGVNAYEMAHGGSLFQNTYLRAADYYNLKPPLSMWCIMLGFAIFGNTVFALRFYSALCYVLLAVAVGCFVRKRFGGLASLLSVTFLALNTTAFQAHMIRSGDADSLYVLLFTLAMLCMMNIKDNIRNLYLCGLFFSLAFLTKSFHAGVIAVIGVLFLLWTGQWKKCRLKNWLAFAASILLPLLAWALPRFCVDGMQFFRAMWTIDVLGRTDGTLQNNIAPFTYYLHYFFGAMSGQTTVYLCALFLCVIGCFVFYNILQRDRLREYIGYVLWLVVPFLAFSCVKNKLLWYMYPVLVPLLMLAGIFAAKLIQNKKLPGLLRGCTIAAVIVMTVFYVHTEVQMIGEQQPNEFQELVKEAANESGLKGCRIFVDYNLTGEGDMQKVNSTWSQQDVFVAEIFGDYACTNGGLEGLPAQDELEHKTGLLFVGKDVYEQRAALYDANELVTQSDGYLVYLVEY